MKIARMGIDRTRTQRNSVFNVRPLFLSALIVFIALERRWIYRSRRLSIEYRVKSMILVELEISPGLRNDTD